MHLDGAPDLAVERIVTVPVLDGPALEGVPADARGFIPVDAYARVRGLERVYAIGDAADLLVKQGGLACQQADVAAASIAHALGAGPPAEPLQPVLRGRLLTAMRTGSCGATSATPTGRPARSRCGGPGEDRGTPPQPVAGRARPGARGRPPPTADSLAVEVPLGPPHPPEDLRP